MTTLEKKVSQSVRLIRSVYKAGNVIVAYSGGKDSDVMRHLCIEAKVPFTMVYNSTTIDPPYTISRNLSLGVKIQRPKYTFLELVARKGLPSLTRRWCCELLKEQYIAPRLLLGVRQAESIKRKSRYIEPTSCRVFRGKKKCDQIYPLLTWSDDDISNYIINDSIKCHPLYYDDGIFNVNKRLGCIGCPLLGDRGRSDFIKYPKMLRQWARAYSKYVSSHKAIEGIYEDLVWHLFYSNHGNDKFQQSFHGLFQPPSAKGLLEDYFHIKLD